MLGSIKMNTNLIFTNFLRLKNKKIFESVDIFLKRDCIGKYFFFFYYIILDKIKEVNIIGFKNDL